MQKSENKQEKKDYYYGKIHKNAMGVKKITIPKNHPELEAGDFVYVEKAKKRGK